MHRTHVRRRLVALGSALMLVAWVSGTMARALSLGEHAERDGRVERVELAGSRTHVVRSGESLWTIAAAIAPDRDPREVVDELERLNPGASDLLVQGQVLRIHVPP